MRHREAAIAGAKPTSHFVKINGLKLHYFDWGGANRKRTILLHCRGSIHAS
jgi:hypothetical protein